MNNFGGKVAVITGAASGIGRALAIQLAQLGAKLALADIDAAGLSETSLTAETIGAECLCTQLDVADSKAMEAFASAVIARYGQADLLFNNAGVALLGDFDEGDESDFKWLMEINFWGVVHGTRAFLPYLKHAARAHIINVSSLFGLLGVPGQTAYCAAKFAVRGFSEALSLELAGTSVSVSSVYPAGIQTRIVANSRVVTGDPAATREEAARKFEALAVTTPAQAASRILSGVKHNRRRILVGRDAWVADFIVRIFPSSYSKILRFGREDLFRQ